MSLSESVCEFQSFSLVSGTNYKIDYLWQIVGLTIGESGTNIIAKSGTNNSKEWD